MTYNNNMPQRLRSSARLRALVRETRISVNDLIMPVIGKLVGNVDFANLYVVLTGETFESAAAAREAGAAAIYYGAFINTVIAFLIIALVMYLIVRTLMRMQKPAEEGLPTTKECPYCRSTIPIGATRCAHCTSEIEISWQPSGDS